MEETGMTSEDVDQCIALARIPEEVFKTALKEIRGGMNDTKDMIQKCREITARAASPTRTKEEECRALQALAPKYLDLVINGELTVMEAAEQLLDNKSCRLGFAPIIDLEKTRLGPSERPTPQKSFNDAVAELKDRGWECGLPENQHHFFTGMLKAGFTRPLLPAVIVAVEEIVKHQPITVRGVFYRVVSTCLIYNSTADKHYTQIQNIVLRLRRAGVIPYSYISDSTRRTLKPSSWSGLSDFAKTCRDAYRLNFWDGMESHLEIFCEKDAMTGVIEPVIDKYDLALHIVRGNSSDGYLEALGREWEATEKPIHGIYLGDFDPNGLDIERDTQQRLLEHSGRPFYWQRVAITEDDFTGGRFPHLKAKTTDTRFPAYQKKWGNGVVEVDAVDPNEIRQRLENLITNFIPSDEWERLQRVEKVERESLEVTLKALGGKA